MIDNKIMYEIIEKLHESFSASISICDVSGRVIVSTDSSCMGEMNLLAIEALNINSKVTVSMDSKIQKAGAAMPLRFQKSLSFPRKNKTGPRSGTSFSMNGCTCSPIIRKIL